MFLVAFGLLAPVPMGVIGAIVGWAIGLGRMGAVVGPWVAGYLIAAGLSMSALYFVFAIPMAIGGLLAWLTHVK